MLVAASATILDINRAIQTIVRSHYRVAFLFEPCVCVCIACALYSIFISMRSVRQKKNWLNDSQICSQISPFPKSVPTSWLTLVQAILSRHNIVRGDKMLVQT